jgi:hypothetical protein
MLPSCEAVLAGSAMVMVSNFVIGGSASAQPETTNASNAGLRAPRRIVHQRLRGEQPPVHAPKADATQDHSAPMRPRPPALFHK